MELRIVRRETPKAFAHAQLVDGWGNIYSVKFTVQFQDIPTDPWRDWPRDVSIVDEEDADQT